MPTMSHLMRPNETEASLPIMVGARQKNRRQDQSSLLNFEKYLLAASPPINFAFSYVPSQNQAAAEDINNNNKYSGGCGLNGFDSNRLGGIDAKNRLGGIDSNHLGGIDSKVSYPLASKGTNANEVWSRKISLPENNGSYIRSRKTGIYGYNFKESPSCNDLLISELCSALESGVSLSTETISRSCLRNQLLTDKLTAASTPRVKKVSFADCVGFPLFNVRIIQEMPDTPSVVNPAVIQRHAAACLASTSAVSTSSEEPKPSSTDVINTSRTSHFLIPNFSMPAANYAEFREKLDKEFVSLESVHLSDHTGALVGTVRVKDVAFDKSVYLRCTFDEWVTHTDVAATYVVPRVPTPANVPCFATFSFRLELPEDSRSGCKFAVSYTTQGREYWDNNGGDNYELVCPDWNGSRTGLSSEARYNRNSTEGIFNSTDLEPESGCWLGVDSQCPYY